MKRAGFFLVWILCLGWVAGLQPVEPVSAEDAVKGRAVYWVPLEEEVERGLTQFLKRAFQEAEQADAGEIVLEMDTLGGEVNAALEIGKLIRHSSIPVTVYIKGEAISAGSYIALNTDHILMAPGSAMGAAEPRTLGGEKADPKTVAFWRSNMSAAAESQNRDPEIAAGMVDRNIEIQGLKKKGELISLSAEQAVKLDMADQIVQNEGEVLRFLKADSSDVIRAEMTWGERLARFITSPVVIPILFTIGLAGIAIEVFSPGFGLPGAIGLSAFGLYFFGHYLAGFAGSETIVLFVAGILLMIIEIFVPGFGIFGILGLVALGAAVVSAAYDKIFSLVSLLIAMVVTGVGAGVAIKYFGAKGIWRRFVLSAAQNNKTGYTSNQQERYDLIGKQGKTVTPLRPAGTAEIEGVRQDVVSRGEFIPPDTSVEVVDTEGVRVVVRPVANEGSVQ
ncbi:NfeD family protein [Paludifilum halophilum]|uniref:Uncharacterized protein n=1 Tax=Paludifilum halophilum TaxID=1642702 RepID=A0A235B5T8_9BACL|nr:nodulation protein NfeD [Paludifilum halophilum]OYD07664.1 hypothetical protein CHM34_09285 [Paludifilum halophilum]